MGPRRDSLVTVFHPVGFVALATLIAMQATEGAVFPVVSLQQIGGPATAVPGSPTFVSANLVVGGGFTPYKVSGFQTLMGWSTSSPGVSGTSLYTVNSSTQAATNTSILANESGFLFSGSSAPFVTVLGPSTSTRDIQVNWNLQNGGYPDLVSGVTVARVQFAVAAGISNASFSFDLQGSPDLELGFVDESGNFTEFTNGGGTITVVPEPEISAFVFLGAGVFAVGWTKGRRWRGLRA